MGVRPSVTWGNITQLSVAGVERSPLERLPHSNCIAFNSNSVKTQTRRISRTPRRKLSSVKIRPHGYHAAQWRSMP
jgi:hypothetical protein